LRVSPSLGRGIATEEDQPGASQVAVISNALWKRRFGADPAVLRKTVTLNNKSCVIVGVMPADFEYPKGSEIWLAVKNNADSKLFDQRGSNWLQVIARLKSGVTLKIAQSEMATIATRLQKQFPAANKDWNIKVVSLQDAEVGEIRPALWSFLGAVFFVLLIACANVASLLLARNSARETEVAVRLALGAKRVDIVRQLLTEGLLLSLLGGILGIGLAYCGLQLLFPQLKSARIPRLDKVGIDVWVTGFTLALSIITTLIFGMLPALRGSRATLSQSLNEKQSVSIHSSQKRKLRGLLVIIETGLSLVLLASASLLITSFLRLSSVNPGFNPNQLVTFSINLRSLSTSSEADGNAKPDEFYQRLSDLLQELPGVKAVGNVTTLPMTGSASTMAFHIQEHPRTGQEFHAAYDAASPGYFQAMQIPLLRGRDFTEQDHGETPPVIVISQQMAKEFFPAEDPLGKHIVAGKGGGRPHEIVGVVGNVKHEGLYVQDQPAMYVPMAQDPWIFSSFVLRTEQRPASISGEVRQTVWKLNKTVPVFRLMTMDEIVSTSIVRQHFNSLLLGTFAMVALLLAAIGLYGMMSYSVSLRTHEIGIRMALGAPVKTVRNMVLKEGIYLALGGIGVGLIGTLIFTRFLKTMLFGVGQTDPTTLWLVSSLLLCIALVASYIPARRATKVNPLIALRHE
jgi:putative ABC transport system permease protein